MTYDAKHWLMKLAGKQCLLPLQCRGGFFVELGQMHRRRRAASMFQRRSESHELSTAIQRVIK